MKCAQVHNLLDETCKACHELLAVKGHEYSGDDDALSNFKRASARLGVNPMTVLLVYLDKHLDSIHNFVLDAQLGRTTRGSTSEPITGRVDDAINYLILFKALYIEGIHNAAQTMELYRDLHRNPDWIDGSAGLSDPNLPPVPDPRPYPDELKHSVDIHGDLYNTGIPRS